eukprot:COSAG01_NODE_369_length_18046_cov_130.301443_12_plen_211_part_00
MGGDHTRRTTHLHFLPAQLRRGRLGQWRRGGARGASAPSAGHSAACGALPRDLIGIRAHRRLGLELGPGLAVHYVHEGSAALASGEGDAHALRWGRWVDQLRPSRAAVRVAERDAALCAVVPRGKLVAGGAGDRTTGGAIAGVGCGKRCGEEVRLGVGVLQLELARPRGCRRFTEGVCDACRGEPNCELAARDSGSGGGGGAETGEKEQR